MSTTIRIATRNSPLALWQANDVKERLLHAHDDITVEIIGMTTKGDQMLDRSLSKIGGKGLFLKELEVSLLDDETDIAVHSMKDVPVEIPQGLEIAVVCERADPTDAFVSNDYSGLRDLPKGAVIGTSSLRRISQLSHSFPHLKFAELRGNVNTRLNKLDDGEYDAIILASAGLKRLGFQSRIKQSIDVKDCLPAVGQGIVGVECRSDDKQTKKLLASLHHQPTAQRLEAERAMNAALEGGCQVPIAGYACFKDDNPEGNEIYLRGLVASVDGKQCIRAEQLDTPESAAQLGKTVAEQLIEQGAQEILQSVYANK